MQERDELIALLRNQTETDAIEDGHGQIFGAQQQFRDDAIAGFEAPGKTAQGESALGHLGQLGDDLARDGRGDLAAAQGQPAGQITAIDIVDDVHDLQEHAGRELQDAALAPLGGEPEGQEDIAGLEELPRGGRPALFSPQRRRRR